MKRVCQQCGARVRAVPGRWIHDERGQGTVAARAADNDHRVIAHRVIAVRGAPRPRPKPEKPAEPKAQPHPPVAETTVVEWGPPMRFERWLFNPDRTRLAGCAEAAGTGRIGTL